MDRLVASGDRICESESLVNGGPGIRFRVIHREQPVPAFAIRHVDRVQGYLNRCAHKLVELDWEPGQFFDTSGQFLVCATHGALYEPASGACLAGPCRGAALVPLLLQEHDGAVWLAESAGAMLK